MIGALVPGAVLCCTAALADRAARQWHWPSRWIWLCAMLGSIALPLVGPVVPQFAPAGISALVPFDAASAAAAAPSMRAGAALGPLRGEALARGLCIASSLLVAALLLWSAGLLRRRARGWRRASIDGIEVYVAPQAGPAVFGWWQPHIVLPAWLAHAPARQRELALAHERSHIDARDPQLLALACVMLVGMPWNPAVWWQLRRLRHAIEVDCDSRVLRSGHDLMEYCEALLAFGLRRSRQHGLMAASDASKSLLERRIRIMSMQRNQWTRLAAGAMLGTALCAAAIAAELAPVPAAPAAPLAHLPAAPPAPAVAALPAPPPVPAIAAVGVPDSMTVEQETGSESDAVEAAKAEAEEAAERAAELKNDAEEAEKAAQEARRDADEQRAQAEAAKREAEAAEVEAKARRQAAEDAARSVKPQKRVN